MTHPAYANLDNPVWHAANGAHRHLTQSAGNTRWYPSTIAPFIAIPSADIVPDLEDAVRHGLREPVYFVGVLPHALPHGWRFAARSRIFQMLPAAAAPAAADERDIRLLGIDDRPSMLGLAQIAFPDFFRERTAVLGEYLGIFAGERLIAMAGERLALDGLQEISGVCTHPDFVGRGAARRLTQALMRRQRARGVASFLHVSEGNAVAHGLYESMSFAVRAALPLGRIERVPASL